MNRFGTWLYVALLLVLPSPAFGQGVEQAPTGVTDMAPRAPNTGEASPPAWLGVLMDDDGQGVRIDTIVNGSPAARSGLQPGDIIESIGGEDVQSADEVREAVRESTADNTLEIALRRGEQAIVEHVELEAAPGLPVILQRHFVGHPAPALEWTSVVAPDDTQRLDEYDRPVVVEFWATWCSPCKPMRDFLGGLSAQVGPSVAFVAVSSEDLKRLQRSGARETARGSSYIPLGKVRESALSNWIIEAYPTVFVIRQDGTVAGAFTGLESRDAIGEMVRKLAGESDATSDDLLPAD
jgi:thiol-disulfide isomerase/thioredoxin